ncbi:hypothetical protein Ancab_001450 [Ancistrocladus abbreviatus]
MLLATICQEVKGISWIFIRGDTRTRKKDPLGGIEDGALAKESWRFREKYIEGDDDRALFSNKGTVSPICCGIQAVWALLRKGTMQCIGNRKSTLFWVDLWMPRLGTLTWYQHDAIAPYAEDKCMTNFTTKDGGWDYSLLR